MYSAWGETRYSFGATPTDRLYTGQYEAEAGLYFYNARWYDNQLGRFAQADTIVPDPGNPQIGIDMRMRGIIQSTTLIQADTMYLKMIQMNPDIFRMIHQIPTPIYYSALTQKRLRKKYRLLLIDWRIIAMDFDHFALAVDTFAETIVLGYVGMGIFGGTIFEGNPVSGIPSGAGAGWIIQNLIPLSKTL